MKFNHSCISFLIVSAVLFSICMYLVNVTGFTDVDKLATVQSKIISNREQLQVILHTTDYTNTAVDELVEISENDNKMCSLELEEHVDIAKIFYTSSGLNIIKETFKTSTLSFPESNLDVSNDTEFHQDIDDVIIETIDDISESVTHVHQWIRYYTDSQYAEYPVACQVWQILRSWGWNEAVSAGIIGNMMTECGGLTLDLEWDLYDDTGMFYGLCMWSLKWASETAGLSIEDQMQYLYDTIEVNMDYFGGDFQEFLNIADPGYAALYFQWYYEVGLSSETRYAGALEAYEYFRSK